jgi:hypothetical protein
MDCGSRWVLHRLFILNAPSECITHQLVVIVMVRFFDKIKSTFSKKPPSTPPEDPLATVHPSPEIPASTSPDPVGTALATSGPAVVEDTSLTHTSSATASKLKSSPVIRTQTASMKRSHVRTRRVRRPRAVIRERSATPPEVAEDSDSKEKSVSPSEPVTDVKDPEKPASSPRHMIMRKPKAQKRRRKIRVVKPKVRVVR